MAALTAEIGEEEEKTLIEIVHPSDGRIDTSKLVDHVRDPAAGAIATFEGTTRDTFDGKRVVELRYEAYVTMAVRQIRSIVSAARSRWPLHRAAVAHRLGTVPVGDASVFVAVSSVHRADALEACREMTISGGFGRVFEVESVYRAENSYTCRHLYEFIVLDTEMEIKEQYCQVMDVVDRLFVEMSDCLNAYCKKVLDSVNRQYHFQPLKLQYLRNKGVNLRKLGQNLNLVEI